MVCEVCCLGRLNNCIYGQTANAWNWPQAVEAQPRHNVCFQLGAWSNSVKSMKLNSSSMLWAQARREQGGFTGRKSQLAWSSSQTYFLPHRLDIFKMLSCCWMQEDTVVCLPASDEFRMLPVYHRLRISFYNDLSQGSEKSCFSGTFGRSYCCIICLFFFFFPQRLLMINLKTHKPAGPGVKGSFNLTE